jgi:hypothetical protein
MKIRWAEKPLGVRFPPPTPLNFLEQSRPPSPAPSDDDCGNTLPLDGIFRAAAAVTARKTATDGDDCDEPEGAFRKFLASAAFGRG